MSTINYHTMYVHETDEAFIFQTLSDFADRTFRIYVEKEELIQAIQLIRMMKEHGESVHEHWVTATQQSEALGLEYRRGFQDGAEKERNRIADILSKGE